MKFGEETIEQIVKDLIPSLELNGLALRAGRKGPYQEGYLLEGVKKSVIEWAEDDRKKREDPEFKLSAVGYWGDIARAKIEVIGILGGHDLMQQVYRRLRMVSDAPVNLAERFNWLAEGIAGWFV